MTEATVKTFSSDVSSVTYYPSVTTAKALTDVANIVKNYLMQGYAPELSATVQWVSVGSPNYSPTSTNPSSVVANLTNKRLVKEY